MSPDIQHQQQQKQQLFINDRLNLGEAEGDSAGEDGDNDDDDDDDDLGDDEQNEALTKDPSGSELTALSNCIDTSSIEGNESQLDDSGKQSQTSKRPFEGEGSSEQQSGDDHIVTDQPSRKRCKAGKTRDQTTKSRNPMKVMANTCDTNNNKQQQQQQQHQAGQRKPPNPLQRYNNRIKRSLKLIRSKLKQLDVEMAELDKQELELVSKNGTLVQYFEQLEAEYFKQFGRHYKASDENVELARDVDAKPIVDDDTNKITNNSDDEEDEEQDEVVRKLQIDCTPPTATSGNNSCSSSSGNDQPEADPSDESGQMQIDETADTQETPDESKPQIVATGSQVKVEPVG